VPDEKTDRLVKGPKRMICSSVARQPDSIGIVYILLDANSWNVISTSDLAQAVRLAGGIDAYTFLGACVGRLCADVTRSRAGGDSLEPGRFAMDIRGRPMDALGAGEPVVSARNAPRTDLNRRLVHVRAVGGGVAHMR